MSEIQIHCKYDELVNPKNLKNHPKNRNKHGQDQIDRLAELYKYHGVRHPIIVSNLSKAIVAGHGRKLAAIRAGVKEMPVVYQTFKDNEAEYAFLTADNAIASWSELDFSGINMDVADLGPDFDINMLGIRDFKIDANDTEEARGDEDEVPGLARVANAKLGQIYQLGQHRLMCGDSTDQLSVEKLLEGKKIDMVFTDPPYGINEKGDRSKRNGKNSLSKGVIYADFKDDSTQYAIKAFNLCQQFDIGTQVWFGANYYCHSLPETNNWLVWDKRIEEKQRDFNSDCELAWVANGKNSTRIFRHLWKGLIKGSEHGQARVHPTQKPTALAEWCFNEYGDPQTVLDLFGGSGSTLIACEKTKRKCFMMELDPHYVDVIIARWEKFTGKKAELLNG